MNDTGRTLTTALKRAEPYGGLGLAIAQNRGIFSELRSSGKEILPKTVEQEHHSKVRKGRKKYRANRSVMTSHKIADAL